jgi:hypothetical protein
MIRLGFLAIIVLCAVSALTNPAQDFHKKAVYTKVATEKAQSGLLGKIAVDLLGEHEILPLSYNNYILFSTTTLNGELSSVGIFSQVWCP